MLDQLMGPYRGRDDLKIDDLVHHAAEIVPQVAGTQGRHKVTAIPDARTVRYYIQEGLVDPPHGSAGQAALYGYRHLLQLVTVKVLQSHYLPIRKIRETIEKLKDRELERLAESWASPCSAKATVQNRLTTGSPVTQLRGFPAAPPGESEAGSSPGPLSARAYLESLGTARLDAARQEAREYRLPGAGERVPSSKGWTRYELYPGIELHIREGVQFPTGPSFLSVLASRFRVILAKLTRSRP